MQQTMAAAPVPLPMSSSATGYHNYKSARELDSRPSTVASVKKNVKEWYV
jgi:hypothetical protein